MLGQVSTFLREELNDRSGKRVGDRLRLILCVAGVSRRTIIKQIISVIVMGPGEKTGESEGLLAHTVTRWLRADMVP